MMSSEYESFLHDKLGELRHLVKREARVLVAQLQPDERILTIGIATRPLLLGPEHHLLAATDQRLLLVSPSDCEDLDYASVSSASHDPRAGAVSLVTESGVRALSITPAARADEIITAIAAHCGADHVHPAAGAEHAWRMRRALIGTIVSVCVFAGLLVVDVALQRAEDAGGQQNGRVPDHLAQGACLGLDGRSAACRSPEATFVVLKARGSGRCRNSAFTAAELVITKPLRAELSRWCIAWNTHAR